MGFSINKLNLKNRIILAPLQEVANLPFRILCRQAGVSLAYTEMINIPGMVHKNKKTDLMLKTNNEDSPLGIQITGSNINDYKKIVPLLKNYSLVDINCGCPSDRTIDSESGSYLLNYPEKIAEIIKYLKSQDLIVTAKIRLGFKENNALKISKIIENAGADAIAVHARLANQAYNVKADWSWIKKVKFQSGIPIIGNGDIFTGSDAERMLDICDAAMIGRASIGNPLVFKQILQYLKTKKEYVISNEDRIDQFKKYLILSEKYSMINLAQMKHIGCHFVRGLPQAASLRQDLMKINNFSELKSFVEKVNTQF